jgi:hypothetical protein
MLSIRKFAIGIALIGAALLAGVALVGEIRLREPADPLASLQREADAQRARADRLQRELDELKAPRGGPAAPTTPVAVVSDAPAAAESVPERADANSLAILTLGEWGDRYVVIEQIKQSGDRSLVSRAVDILMNDPNSHFAGSALELILMYGLSEKIPAVIALLANEYNQQHAAQTLGKLGDPRAVPALASAYAAGSLSMKRAAAEALRDLGQPEYVQDFVALASRQMLTDLDGELRHEALVELGQLADPARVPLLTQALADSNSRVRLGAAQALGEIGDASAIPYLEAMHADPVPVVRRAAADSIRWIQDPSTRVWSFGAMTWTSDSSMIIHGTKGLQTLFIQQADAKNP